MLHGRRPDGRKRGRAGHHLDRIGKRWAARRFARSDAGGRHTSFVDLEIRTVTGELNVGDSPMGIAITPEGKRAFVGLFSESYFAEVDLEKRSYKRMPTGGSFNEEFAIDDTGTVGIMT